MGYMNYYDALVKLYWLSLGCPKDSDIWSPNLSLGTSVFYSSKGNTSKRAKIKCQCSLYGTLIFLDIKKRNQKSVFEVQRADTTFDYLSAILTTWGGAN